jgi:hypothetical protein
MLLRQDCFDIGGEEVFMESDDNNDQDDGGEADGDDEDSDEPDESGKTLGPQPQVPGPGVAVSFVEQLVFARQIRKHSVVTQ